MSRRRVAGAGAAGLALGLAVGLVPGKPPCPDCSLDHVVEPEAAPVDPGAALVHAHGAFAPLMVPDAGTPEVTESGAVAGLPSGLMTVDVAADGRTATDASGTGATVILVGASPGRHTYRVQAAQESGPLGPRLEPGTYLVLAEVEAPPLVDDMGPPGALGVPVTYPVSP